jgi:integrase
MNSVNRYYTKSDMQFSLKNATLEFSLIRVRMTINGVRFSYCLPKDCKIKPCHWDKQNGCAIEDSKRNPDLKGNPTLQVIMRNINKEIEKTTNTLIQIIETFKLQNIRPAAKQILAELRKSLKGIDDNQRKCFDNIPAFIDYYMALCKDGTIRNANGTQLKAGSIRNYLSTKSAIERYCEARHIKNLRLDDINMGFYNDFVNFLTEATHSRGKYKPNVIGKFQKELKAVMRYAYDNGYTTNDSFKRRDFKVFRENVETIYLTEEELGQLKMLDLPQNRAQVRDSFLASCYTGLRYGDTARLSTKHINYQTNQITITTQKTNTQVIIPIHPIVREIFERYGQYPPKVQCNQATNRMLKELCRKAGITGLTTIMETRGGVREEKSYAKCDMVTTHTARRSFATNAYLNSIPAISIMKMTGHKTESSFMRYIRIGIEENAKTLQEHQFFN